MIGSSNCEQWCETCLGDCQLGYRKVTKVEEAILVENSFEAVDEVHLQAENTHLQQVFAQNSKD